MRENVPHSARRFSIHLAVTSLFAAFLISASLPLAAAEPDAPFVKITDGELVTESRDLNTPAWGDYDGDGDIDLYIAAFSGQNLLFKNNGNGTFTRQTAAMAGPIVGTAQSGLGLWADFDNDGDLDLFKTNDDGVREQLFRNNGAGVFELATIPAFSTDVQNNFSAAWADFDRDGFIDLAVARGFIDGSRYTPSQVLFRNTGDGLFARLTNAAAGDVITQSGGGTACSWADFDNDGDPDLFIGNNGSGSLGDHLFRNDGAGRFTRITEGPVANDTGFAFSSAWGDYDNDGNLDLFVGNGRGQRNFLYRNLGNGQFEEVTQGSVVEDRSPAFTASSAWADYDNDGHLDLYVGNKGRNFLYHNNGDGTFERVFTGDPATDTGTTIGVTWADYDNDGFLDLFVANGGGDGAQLSQLYRNTGSTNHWLKLRLLGTASNRSAIGAKVRVKTTINGKLTWQLREVSGGYESGQGDQRPNFGLGNATVAEIVRIEWPSSIVQELHNVSANQFLTVTEPAKLEPHVTQTNGLVELRMKSWKGFVYDLEASSDLKSWTRLTTLTNQTGTLSFADLLAATVPARFYRVRPN